MSIYHLYESVRAGLQGVCVEASADQTSARFHRNGWLVDVTVLGPPRHDRYCILREESIPHGDDVPVPWEAARTLAAATARVHELLMREPHPEWTGVNPDGYRAALVDDDG